MTPLKRQLTWTQSSPSKRAGGELRQLDIIVGNSITFVSVQSHFLVDLNQHFSPVTLSHLSDQTPPLFTYRRKKTHQYLFAGPTSIPLFSVELSTTLLHKKIFHFFSQLSARDSIAPPIVCVYIYREREREREKCDACVIPYLDGDLAGVVRVLPLRTVVFVRLRNPSIFRDSNLHLLLKALQRIRKIEKRFPVDAKDYKLYEEVGEGVSATVFRALCIPLNEIVAIKVLDLEKCNNDLDGIRREVHTMTLTDHPNLLRAHCSFTTGHSLWVVMPYMAGGSCLHIMKSAYPEGFEEPVIATLLREVLKALVYLHAHGHIHRDVKAGNILIDTNGAVKVADFGVSACMFDTGDRQRSRNTFVGTPCWMAPEVMQQLHGYDFKADIWSFGITSLELAHGHAPFSKYPPMKVLLMTLQNAPPGLDYERDKRFSKSFKEMVAACLVKDPKKRPTSEKLLKHPFFKHARPNDYLARTILDGLAPLGERFRMLKVKESEFLVQNKAQYGDKEQLSQQEYIRGISAWNFNLEDLKNEAALIQDYDDVSTAEDPVLSRKPTDRYNNVAFPTERISPERANHSNALPRQEDVLSDLHDLDSSLASFPSKPLQALKGYFDVGENDVNGNSPNWKDAIQSDSELQVPSQSSPGAAYQEVGRNDGENMGRSSSLPRHVIPEHKIFFSGSLLQQNAPLKKGIVDGDRDCPQPRYQSERNYSAPLFRQWRDTSNLSLAEETSEGAVVQRKGRFKVTSAELSPKGPNIAGPVCGGSTSPTAPSLTAASIIPSLQCILQQNNMQRDQIIKLIKYLEQTSGKHMEYPEPGSNDLSQVSPASSREKELQSQVIHLQESIKSLIEELQTQKMRNAQLERQLNALVNKEGNIRR